MNRKMQMAFVVIKTQPNGESEGAAELQEHLDMGFEPFGVTSYVEQHQASKIAGGAPLIKMCDKIWLKRVMPQATEALPETHNPS